MNLTFAIVTILLGITPVDTMSRQQLVQLINTAQETNCQDVSFDYEGGQFIQGADGAAYSLVLSYTGSFTRRSDGAILVDLYRFDKPLGKPSRNIVAILNGTTGYSSQLGDEKNSKVSIKRQGPLEHAGPANFRQIWLADWVKKLAESAYLFEYEGVRKLDGEDCAVARFRLAYDDSTPKEKTVSFVFWIDLNRGGHVVRFEQRQPGENLAELTTVILSRFDRGQGRVAWLPTSGRVENRMIGKDGKPVFLDDPYSYTTYSLLPITLRFDQGFKDDTFSVKVKTGDAVSDEVRKARYEFGQYMVRTKASTKRPTDADIKANLERMLKDSAVMANELKASSPSRDGPGVLSLWPWATAGFASLVAGFLYYKNKRRYP